jgi:uncharacterized membrane protein YkoI
MPNTSKYVIGIAAAAAISLGAGVAAAATTRTNTDPPSEQTAERVYTAAHRRDAAVSQARAEQLAQQARPGSIVESHLQTEGDGLRWEVKTNDSHHVWEVQLDPATGAVVGNQADE